MAAVDTGPRVCKRCNENEPTHTIRSEPTCGSVKSTLYPNLNYEVILTNMLAARATADMCR